MKIGQDFIGREPFVFYLGDNMVVGGIERYRDEFLARKSNCHLALARVRDPERFGVPEIAGDRIVSVVEKPKVPKSQFAVTGIYFYDESVFEAVHNIQPSARGELEISDAHDYLIRHGKRVTFSEITGWWKDTGLPDDLLEANRLVLDHMEPAQAEGVRIEGDSQVVGRVVLQRGARIVAEQRPRPGHHRREHGHREFVHRPVHLDLPRLPGRAQRGGIQHRPGELPHREHRRPHRGQPARVRLATDPRARQAAHAPLRRRRPGHHRDRVSLAIVHFRVYELVSITHGTGIPRFRENENPEQGNNTAHSATQLRHAPVAAPALIVIPAKAGIRFNL